MSGKFSKSPEFFKSTHDMLEVYTFGPRVDNWLKHVEAILANYGKKWDVECRVGSLNYKPGIGYVCEAKSEFGVVLVASADWGRHDSGVIVHVGEGWFDVQAYHHKTNLPDADLALEIARKIDEARRNWGVDKVNMTLAM